MERKKDGMKGYRIAFFFLFSGWWWGNVDMVLQVSLRF